MKNRVSPATLLLTLALAASPAFGKVETAPIFSDHAVFQSGERIPVWGSGSPGEFVEVAFAAQTRRTRVKDDGTWRVHFSPMRASPVAYELCVRGSTRKVFRNVMIGEAWVASGQSNMAMTVRRSKQDELARRDPFPTDVRFFDGSRWKVATLDNLGGLSAVPWAFAREIALARKVPVGMIVVARGGTRIESWMPRHALVRTEPGKRLAALAEDPAVITGATEDAKKFKPYPETNLYRWRLGRALPMHLYNELIAPLRDLPVRGVLWYQGENNAAEISDAENYRFQLVHLIEAWREQWNRKDLPFFVVGIPEYHPKSGEGSLESWEKLRESQRFAINQLKGVVLVDAFDLGDVNDVHPTRKYEVGQRLAERAKTLR